MTSSASQPLRDLLPTNSLQRLRSILEERDDAVVSLLDADLQLIWISRRGGIALFGEDPMHFEGMSGLAFIHPDDVAHAEEALCRAVAGETVDYHSRARAPQAEEWVLLRTVAWPVDPSERDRSRQRIVAVTVPRGSD